MKIKWNIFGTRDINGSFGWTAQQVVDALRSAGVQDIVPCISSDMEDAISRWNEMYTARDPKKLPKKIASEFARLVTVEMKSQINNDAYLDEQYQALLPKLRYRLEQAFALGSMVFKPFINGEKIGVEFVPAGRFVPLGFDIEGNMTDAVFIDQRKKQNTNYTRFEIHRLTPNGVFIENRAFKERTPVPLEIIPEWTGLQPDILIRNTERPLFAFFHTPQNNTIDQNSFLGASVFDTATEMIDEANKQFARLAWEFEGGELAIDADVTALKLTDKNKFSLPRLQNRLFRRMNADPGTFYEVFSPALRDVSLLNGLDSMLRDIEEAVGLSPGTYSDPRTEARTATELKILRQRSYSTVADLQTATENALRSLTECMKIFASLYDVGGVADAVNVSDIDMTFTWDDSILTDDDAEFAQQARLVQMNILRPEELRAWYTGESLEEAAANLPDVPKPVEDDSEW